MSFSFAGARVVGCRFILSPHTLYLSSSLRCRSDDVNGFRIYTRTGDKGTSSLYTGERRPKSDTAFEALGATDELSSHIGLAKEFASEKNHEYVEQLERIQCILQDIGTLVATPKAKVKYDEKREERIKSRLGFNPRHITELEEWIDSYSVRLPPLTNFILPGGGRISASLHVARTVCRRTERAIVPLTAEQLIDNQVLTYVNRLSDYLFTVARYASVVDGMKETIYIRPKPKWKKPIVSQNQQVYSSEN
ncbi:corrinoid adenosyltransferase MMAB-like [Oratosquilla oratoria]|uniref:corrinoid adenosyltransferase MMAB-like n=1 Tax=Oratosquilla oratoria TaxID=337810 RepID=UPI003F777384